MNKTILFKKKPGTDIDYDIKILKEFDMKQNNQYVMVDEDKKIYVKMFNLISDAYSDIENIRKLRKLEEELVYGCDMDYDIVIPKSFIGKPFKIFGKIIKVKEKHIIKEHIPTTFQISEFNQLQYNHKILKSYDDNIIIINYDFISGKELSFIEAKLTCDLDKCFETNCLEFFNPDMLNRYYDVIVVKKDKSYISLKDLLKNSSAVYSDKFIRDSHNTQKMLVANSFNFKEAIDVFICDEKNLFIHQLQPFNTKSVSESVIKIDTEIDKSKFLIDNIRNINNLPLYSCNTNIYLAEKVLNKRLDYDNVNILFTKNDIEKI